MGVRFRKSINLGGGFRINVSKSGVGYSWGTKGFRITKTAKGTTRKTYSIPRTGISYVSESKKTINSKAASNNNEFVGISSGILAIIIALISLFANYIGFNLIALIGFFLAGAFGLFAIIRGAIWLINYLKKNKKATTVANTATIPINSNTRVTSVADTATIPIDSTTRVTSVVDTATFPTVNTMIESKQINYVINHSYYTKVVGVTFNGIQSILPQLHEGMPVQFIREPNNPFDHNAIGIWCNGKKIGHLSADEATSIAPQMDRGIPYDGEISQITGGKGKTYGCEISVNVYKPSISGLTSQVEHIDESNPMFKKTCVLFGYDNFAAYDVAQSIANLGGFTRQRISGKTDFAIVNKGQPEYELKYTLAKVERYRAEGKKVEIMYSDKLEEIKKAYLNS